MLNKNNIPTGLALGLILPVLAAVVFELLISNRYWIITQRGVPYFYVVGANLIMMRIFASRKQDKTVQGIMIVTFVFMALVYFLRFR